MNDGTGESDALKKGGDFVFRERPTKRFPSETQPPVYQRGLVSKRPGSHERENYQGIGVELFSEVKQVLFCGARTEVHQHPFDDHRGALVWLGKVYANVGLGKINGAKTQIVGGSTQGTDDPALHLRGRRVIELDKCHLWKVEVETVGKRVKARTDLHDPSSAIVNLTSHDLFDYVFPKGVMKGETGNGQGLAEADKPSKPSFAEVLRKATVSSELQGGFDKTK